MEETTEQDTQLVENKESPQSLLDDSHQTSSPHNPRHLQHEENDFDLSAITVRPTWVPNEQQNACHICSSQFSLFTRRHHCRACGKICCQNCSQAKLPLKHLGYLGLQRVCSKCVPNHKRLRKRDRRSTMSKPVLQAQMQLTDILGRPLRKYYFSLTANSFRWYKNESEQLAAFYVYLVDVLTVTTPTDQEFVVHAFPQYKQDDSETKIRDHMLIRVLCESMEQRDKWTQAILSRLQPAVDTISQRRLLVLVNPFGGKKQASEIWKGVEPMFQLMSVHTDVRITEKAGHGYELASKLKLGEYDGIVCVSGDGLVHEVFNGLMEHPEWERAITTPVGVIAGGSGNALATVLGGLNPISASFSIIKGIKRPSDLLKVMQKGIEKPRYSFLSVNWGLVSDIDFESEKFRFLGGTRFALSTLIRVTNLRFYRGRFDYIPAPVQFTSFCTLEENCKDCKLSQQILAQRKDPGKWEVIEGEFVTIFGCNLTKLSYDTHPAPFAHLADGAIDILVIHKCTRGELISLVKELETGHFINDSTFNLSPFVKYLKVREFKLHIEGGLLGFDGERAPDGSDLHVTNMNSAITLLG